MSVDTNALHRCHKMANMVGSEVLVAEDSPIKDCLSDILSGHLQQYACFHLNFTI